MHIEIYQYMDGDETCEAGEYMGYISLEEDDVYIDVDDDNLAEQLEELFSEPFIYSEGVPGTDKEAEPYTEDFFRNVLPLLHDLNARGILKEDERDVYTPRTINPEASDDEEPEEIPLDMELSELSTLEEDDYGLGQDEDVDSLVEDEEGEDIIDPEDEEY